MTPIIDHAWYTEQAYMKLCTYAAASYLILLYQHNNYIIYFIKLCMICIVLLFPLFLAVIDLHLMSLQAGNTKQILRKLTM